MLNRITMSKVFNIRQIRFAIYVANAVFQVDQEYGGQYHRDRIGCDRDGKPECVSRIKV
jgi:hypothetical protein